MTEPVRIALLGAGRIARLVHLDVLARLEGARLVAIAEADPEHLDGAGRRVPGAARFTDWKSALDHDGIDAVVICLPNPLHAEAAEAAFARGLHVYLEKPIATSVAEGRRVVDSWRASGRTGMTGFNYRFHPMHLEARARLAHGELGRLVAVRTVFTAPARALPQWQMVRATGGGVLLNLGVHHFDLVPFLTGAHIVSVAATVRTLASDADTAAVQARLEGDVPVQSLFSMAAAPADRIALVGERGTLVLDRLGSGRARFESAAAGAGRVRQGAAELRGLADTARRAAYAWRRRPEPSFRAALGDFVDRIRGGADRAGFPDLAAGLRALEIVDAAGRAAASNGVVMV